MNGIAESDFRVKRIRDPEREQAERDAFLVLCHLYNLCAGRTSASFPIERIGRDLGFDDRAAACLCDLLEWAGLLTKGEPGVSITEEGIEYMRREAGRRRSARPACRARYTDPYGRPLTPW